MRQKRNKTATPPKKGCENTRIVDKKKAKAPPFLVDSRAFGMWKDRDEMASPAEYVRQSRKGRLGNS